MRRHRIIQAAAAATVLTVLSACGGGSSHPKASATSDPFAAASDSLLSSGGSATASAPMRFIDLLPPSKTDVTLVDDVQGTGKKVDAFQRGKVTDYLTSNAGGFALVDGSGRALQHLGYSTDRGVRYTIIVGTDRDGQVVAEGIPEKDGRWSIDVPSEASSWQPSGKAILIVDGNGFSGPSGAADSDVRLGSAARQCWPSTTDTSSDGASSTDPNDGGQGVAPATSPYSYARGAGDTDLVWLTDVSCRTVESKPLHVSLQADHDAYVLPWFADDTHLHTLFVPITKDGKGGDGVQDSGDGPVFSPTNHDTVVDSNSESAADGGDSSSGDIASDASTDSSDLGATDSTSGASS